MAAARIYHPGTCLSVHYKHISRTLLVCLPCEADPLLYVASLLRIPPAYLWLLLFSSLSPPCSAKPVWGMMAVSLVSTSGESPRHFCPATAALDGAALSTRRIPSQSIWTSRVALQAGDDDGTRAGECVVHRHSFQRKNLATPVVAQNWCLHESKPKLGRKKCRSECTAATT